MGATTEQTSSGPPLLSPHGDEGAVVLPSDSTNPVDTEYQDTTMADVPADYFAPPAHLAARFYRNRANTRRKSSATSSRRNSLSSVHSHTSSISNRRATTAATYQSQYVAQHLRRASILESRKARLADRAAHAEQVRLRAALAKSAPRASISNSEEKALAAQIAKEKYLAKVAAACAEEVARAKRIAEEVKERKLAEEARARLEMEERHAEAEKRRAEYQRNLQTRRVRRANSTEKKLGILEEIADADEEAIVEEPPAETQTALSEQDASQRIQQAWHLYARGKSVRSFTELFLQEQAKHASFEEMTALVADPGTISAATGVLMHLGLQDRNDDNAALNSRTFLSAYMIRSHPVAVLNKNGAQEQDLIQKATDLIGQFDACVARLARWNNFTPNSTQLESLSQSYSAYTSAFAAWRLQDSSVLIEGMVASFVELDAIWQTVKDDTRGEVASDYREGIRDNQVMLLSRIRKLAGPDRADVLIKKAIRESRKRRPKKRPAAEVKPRGVESQDQSAQSASESDAAVEGVAISDDEQPASDSDDVALNKIFTPMPSNRVLTHELAIDKDYRLEDTASELRDQVYRSICDSMKRGFEAGDGAAWTVSAAENVREKLLRMLKPGNSMHKLILETMDLDSIARQCQQGVFSYDGFFQFMANVLPKLCAPFRDQEMKTLTDHLESGGSNEGITTMIEKLFHILRMVDKLSLDYTNFMIMNAAPTLIQEAAGYEQRLFAKDLEAGTISLAKTKDWWRRSHAQLTAEADRRDPEGLRNPADRPSSQAVYNDALLTLAVEQGPLDSTSVPETLTLDLPRLRGLRADALRITVIGAILLTAKNLLKRDSRSQWKPAAARLWTLLSAEAYDAQGGEDQPSTAQKAFSVLETAHNMPPATKAQLQGTIARFFAQAAASCNDYASGARLTDPILKLLHQRLRSHVSARLGAATSVERVRAASSASEALAACGMPEFAKEVGGVVEVLERVREVDWKAHGGWYGEVWREVERER